jgi:hypothetical protein
VCRYFVLFGGGALGKCHNDVWVLDTTTYSWFQPSIAGPLPPPRAGCCSALLGNRWYIIGGGNHAAGCPDMWMLDLVPLGVGELRWVKVGDFDRRAALASEGGTVVAASAYGGLVSFGGYNGVYHNVVSAFKPAEISTAGAARGKGWRGPAEDEIAQYVLLSIECISDLNKRFRTS